METMYAIRQSSKGWSDTIYVCKTKEDAEKFVAAFYADQESTKPSYKANWRIEEITCLTW